MTPPITVAAKKLIAQLSVEGRGTYAEIVNVCLREMGTPLVNGLQWHDVRFCLRSGLLPIKESVTK